MNRKEFLGKSLAGGMLPVILGGFSVKAMADSPLVQLLAKAGNEDRVLVLIQLNGGNDGLNTVIPLDQYSNLNNARQNIMIAESKVLRVQGTQATGLHPALPELRNMYNEGKVGIIQNVGYPNPDFSHFRSTDIWLTGSSSNVYEGTGWMGRFLDTEFPGFPTGYPNSAFPDPPAIQIGAMISPAYQGENMSLGMSITDPSSFYQFVNGTVDQAPNTPAGHELSFIRLVAQQTELYSGSVKTAASKATNKSALYPPAKQNVLADQLKIVAQLIAGGLKTQVYMVSLNGFDTHASQVAGSGGTDTGVHANLLKTISVAVDAFQDDLELLGVDDRVLGMTFSEFGRRIRSNDSMGTDHGAAAPLFVFGKQVIGGVYGSNPTIPSSVSVDDNVPMEHDFRSVYATILKDWFGVADDDLADLLLAQQFGIIPFLKSGPVNIRSMVAAGGGILLKNYPNPAANSTTISFSSNGERVRIIIYDNTGREMMVVLDQQYPAGVHELTLDTTAFKQGLYYYQLQNSQAVKTNTLMIKR